MPGPLYYQAQLSPAEVAFALAIATQRDACKPRSLQNSRLSKTQSGFGVHFSGVMGELLFRKVHGGTINQGIYSNGDDHEGDVLLARQIPGGGTLAYPVEVKTSLYTGPDVDLKFEKTELERLIERADKNGGAYVALVQLFMPDTGRVSPVWNIKNLVSSLVEKNYGNGTRFVFRPGRWE